MTAHGDRDREVAAVAARQYGVVTYHQVRACGLLRQAIAWRVGRGRLIPVHAGVYAVGHAQLRREGRWLAAVLHCGERAVLSHGDAAALWGLMPAQGSPIHVSTPRRSGRTPEHPVRLHRVGTLRTDEVTRRDGVPVATVARTLLDLAGTKRPRQLEDLIAQADRLTLFDASEVRRALDAHPRQRGRRELVVLLDQLLGSGAADRRSAAELALAELCDAYDLPFPRANVVVAGFMVDFLWPEANLVVETGGVTYHAMPTAFAADRERDQILMLAGYRVARFTYDQLTRRHERQRSADRLRALLAQSGSL